MPKSRDGERRVTKMTVDFTNVGERRAGGRAANVPDGDYLLKVKEASFSKVKEGSANAGKPICVWVFTIEQPAKHKSAGNIWYRTGMWEEAVFSFRNILEDLREGKPIPKRAAEVDLTKYIGKLVGATLAKDTYNGKEKSEIVDTFPASKFSEGDSDDDEDEGADDDDEQELETSDDDDDEDEDESSDDEDDDL